MTHPPSIDLTAPGWLCLLMAIAWVTRDALRPGSAPSRNWLWWGLVAAVLICFRWPMLWVRHELNVDESQLIAGAITLRHDPVFWRSVDGGTAGPLDFYPLLPAAWMQGAASYAIARLLALAAAWGTLIFAGETLALLAGVTIARAAVLPALTFYAFTREPDFAHYSTEAAPVFLLAAAGYATVRQQTTPSITTPWIAGLLLGAVPWSKLQAAPLAALLGVIAVVQEFSHGRARAGRALILGALLITLGFTFFTWATGQGEHALTGYLLNNVAYVANIGFTFGAIAQMEWKNAVMEGQLGLWLMGGLGFLLFAPALTTKTSTVLRRWNWIATGLFIMAVGCVLTPRRPFCHYLLLIVWPLTLAAGTGLAVLAQRAARLVARGSLAALGLFFILTLVPQIANFAFGEDAFADLNAAAPEPEEKKLIQTMRDFARPGEALAVWGWRSSLYVETGLHQATRQAHSEAQLLPSPRQSFFLKTYYDDVTAANPPLFADAVGRHGFKYVDRIRAHEAFPPLRTWIAKHYTLVADLDGTRLYVRNDRLAAAKLERSTPLSP